jgi:[NiFe] hydrogenase assembly HybE family chaperone
MTELAAPTIERPSPAAALERHFEAIHHGPMAGLPMLNPALRVRALGFQPWNAHWLGVLVTPWFMNLVLMPRLAEHFPPCAERESRHLVFPAGVFEFIGAHDAGLGSWLACSLFSPMFEFADQAGAEATALAALQGLLDGPQPAEPVDAAQPAPAAVSKRNFLFGR